MNKTNFRSTVKKLIREAVSSYDSELAAWQKTFDAIGKNLETKFEVIDVIDEDFSDEGHSAAHGATALIVSSNIYEVQKPEKISIFIEYESYRTKRSGQGKVEAQFESTQDSVTKHVSVDMSGNDFGDDMDDVYFDVVESLLDRNMPFLPDTDE